METRPHRLSMNTSLKNARIFDDDAWEDGDIPKKKVKNEPTEESSKEETSQIANIHTAVKCEPEDDVFEEVYGDKDDIFEEPCKQRDFTNVKIKREPSPETISEDKKNLPKMEPVTSDSVIKQDTSLEEGELEDSMCSKNTLFHNIEIKLETSPEEGQDSEKVDKMFDESPYNKEMFERWKIKDKTPIKSENEESRKMLKSAKRTMFTRPSPYKKQEYEDNKDKISVKQRLGMKVESDEEDEGPRPKRMRNSMETDPVVLARREKQIEYGKNTIGYENYTKMIPKGERTSKDPKTPPKYGKYSRRGWEGLIKQWRIKLHKYDPPEENS